MEINFESVSFVVSIVSIILAIISLIFAVIFYRWSEKSNKGTFELSKGIEGNTKKIEELFDRFYSDTFGLMKSNYEAMQSSLFNKNISSGDSSLSTEEQTETIITSLVSKSKILTRETIYHYFDKVYPKRNLSHSDINGTIDALQAKNAIFINKNLISIASSSDSESDEGGSE